MKTTKTTTTKAQSNATEKKNSRKNAGTVKNTPNSGKKQTTKAAAADEDKKNTTPPHATRRRHVTLEDIAQAVAEINATCTPTKKGTGTKNTKKAQRNHETNTGRPDNHKSQEAARRREAIKAEEADLQKRNEERKREEEAKKAAEEQAADKANRDTVRGQFGAAKKEVKKALTFLAICHHLNRWAAAGRCDESGVDMPAMVWTAEAIRQYKTPTATNYDGYSYDVVKRNSAGQVCRMVKYNPAKGDEQTTAANGARVLITKQHPQGIEYIKTFAGAYMLQPIKTDYNGVISAVESYMLYISAVAGNLSSPTAKKLQQSRDEKKEKKAAEKLAQEIKEARAKKAAAQQAADKAEEEKKAKRQEAAKKAAETRRRKAEEAQQAAEQQTAPTVAAVETKPRRGFFARLRAAMF